MKRNRHIYILALVVVVIGFGLFAYKAFVLGLPLRPEERATHWEIQAKFAFDAFGGPAKLSFFIPRDESPFTIFEQAFVSEGYGYATTTEGDNRRAVFSIRKADDEQVLYHRFMVRRAPFDLTRKSGNSEEPTPRKVRFAEGASVAARGIVRAVEAESADDDTFVRQAIKRLLQEPPTDNVAMLLGARPSMRKRMTVATQLLALEGIPSRVVTGIQLVKSNRHAYPIHWLEAYIDDAWRGFAPQMVNFDVPANFLPWWRGGEPLASVEGGRNLKTVLSVTATPAPALRGAMMVRDPRERGLLDYSLFTLPINTQQVYRIILTVPLGVFFLTILRNVIGVRTMGTFMPVLIAIAFRETQVVWGVLLFTLVVAIGLLVRAYLEKLHLLVVPRLACVLTVVVLTMAGISVLSNQLGIERGLSVALFPMVILSMTVERMSIIWDERGPADMLRQGLGSLIVAVITYYIMVNAYAEHYALVFPELLLVLLAGNLLIGRYSGFRLLDLPRFRVLAGER